MFACALRRKKTSNTGQTTVGLCVRRKRVTENHKTTLLLRDVLSPAVSSARLATIQDTIRETSCPASDVDYVHEEAPMPDAQVKSLCENRKEKVKCV